MDEDMIASSPLPFSLFPSAFDEFEGRRREFSRNGRHEHREAVGFDMFVYALRNGNETGVSNQKRKKTGGFS